MARKPSSLELYNTILEEIRSPKVKPVYAFFGEETFFADRLQDSAIELIPEEARDFNLDILYGRDFTVDKLIDICRSYPMMSDRRTVVVRDFMQMFEKEALDYEGGAGDSTGDDAIEAGNQDLGNQDDLTNYLNRPNPTTLLILISEKKPAQNSRIGKALKKSKVVTSQTFDAVPDFRLQQWIKTWASVEHNLQFEDSAAQLLGYHVGGHLQQLTVEIEKLSNYREDGGAITDQDVRQVVGFNRQYTLFNFSDALLDREADKAMFIAERLMQQAESTTGEVIKIIGFLNTTFGKIWHIQRLSRKGMKPDQIRDATGVNNVFYYEKLVRAGRNYPLATCPWLFEVLLDADKAIKGFSKESPEAILLMTVKKLLSI